MSDRNDKSLDYLLTKARELENAIEDVYRIIDDITAYRNEPVFKNIQFVTPEEHRKMHTIPGFENTMEMLDDLTIEKRIDKQIEKDNYFKANDVVKGEVGKLFEKAKKKVEDNKKCLFDWSEINPPINPDIDTDKSIMEQVPTVEQVLNSQYKGGRDE